MTKARESPVSNFLTYFWRFLSTHHQTLRGSYGEYILVALVFIVATIIYTNFVAFHITEQLFTSGPGDATAGFLWLNFADHSLSPFIPNIDLTNYPDGQQLGGATFITYLALWLPIRVLSYFFGAVAGLNLVTFFGFVSAGLSMYWLLKRLTGAWLVAMFAGYAAAFVPYAVSKSSAHLAYIFSVVFVLIIAGFIAVWSRPTKLRAVLFGLSIALAFYTDGYYLLLGAVTVLGLLVAGVLQGAITGMPKEGYLSRLKFLLLSGACVVVTVIPIAYVQMSQGKDVQQTLSESRPDISKEINAYRSNVMDFIVPPAENVFLKDNSDFQTVQQYKNLRSNHSESLNYIGFTLVGLMAIGGVLLFVLLIAKKFSSLKKIDDPIKKKFILLGSIAVVTIPLFLAFMFSPEVSVAGHTIPLPGKFFIDHNIALWRVMSRFFVPLHVVIVIFAAFSLWLILKPLYARKRRILIAHGIVVLLTITLGLEYATTMYHPSFSFKDIPAVYSWLEKRSDIQTAVELPVVDPLDFHSTRYFTAQVVHKKKLVNKKEPDAERLSNVIGSIDNPETIDWAYQRGAQAVITHGTNCTPEKWGEIIYKDDSKPFGKLCVYKLEKPETHDMTFVRFNGKGFKYVSTPDTDKTVIGVENANSSMTVVGANLESSVNGEVKVTGSLEPLLNKTFNGVWRLLQDGEIVAQGDIIASKATISAKVNAQKSLHLEIKRNDNQSYIPEDLAIRQVISTSY